MQLYLLEHSWTLLWRSFTSMSYVGAVWLPACRYMGYKPRAAITDHVSIARGYLSHPSLSQNLPAVTFHETCRNTTQIPIKQRVIKFFLCWDTPRIAIGHFDYSESSAKIPYSLLRVAFQSVSSSSV